MHLGGVDVGTDINFIWWGGRRFIGVKRVIIPRRTYSNIELMLVDKSMRVLKCRKRGIMKFRVA